MMFHHILIYCTNVYLTSTITTFDESNFIARFKLKSYDKIPLTEPALIYELNTSKKEDHRNQWKDPRVHSSDAGQTTVRQSRLAIGSPTP